MRLQATHSFPFGDRTFGGPAVLVCAPLVARDRNSLILQASLISDLRPDCVEWRCDFLADLRPAEMPELVRAVAEASGRPLIITNRHEAEGGARPQPEEQRLALLEAALGAGTAIIIDMELRADPARSVRVAQAARAAGVRVIRSWHDFGQTPPETVLLEKLRLAKELGADVAKIAVMPEKPEDVLCLLSAGLTARRTFLDIPCITMSMGALGSLSRTGGGFFGSDLTFAVGSRSSAPGQMPLSLVQDCLNVQGVGTKTGVLP